MSLFSFVKLARRLIRHGQLTIVEPNGDRHVIGDAGAGPSVTIRINDPSFVRRLLRRPGIEFGEGYMDGAYSLEEGSLRDFLEIVLVSTASREPRGFLMRALARSVALIGRNDRSRAARNVQHHYDIDHRLYEMFLDEDMQYSCAYWRDGVTSLEEAQRDKKEHIARKLLLEPGMKVLDIGCGWGGLALTLARDHGATVTGVTLSHDQYDTAQRRVLEAGLQDRVTIKLQDYREERGQYDRIVSVGMFEHVGPKNFGEFFDHVDRLLAEEGVALLHTIGRMAAPAPINAWMRKYIFPGAYLPSLSQLMPLLEKRGIWLADLEMLRVHYSKTLAAWNERFQARRPEIAEMFDERFCRMWELYLVLNEVAFVHRPLVVFQMQMAKQIDRVPITRDYLYRPTESVSDRKRTHALRIAGGTDKNDSGDASETGPPQRRRPSRSARSAE